MDGPGNHLQGDPACTAWYTNDDLGRIHYDQNQCHILEVDCEEKDRFMTICMKLPASYVMPDIPCPVTTPLNTGECFSGNWTQVSFRRKICVKLGIRTREKLHSRHWCSSFLKIFLFKVILLSLREIKLKNPFLQAEF